MVSPLFSKAPLTGIPDALGGYEGVLGHFSSYGNDDLPNSAAIAFDTYQRNAVRLMFVDENRVMTAADKSFVISSAYFDSNEVREALVTYDHENTELVIHLSGITSGGTFSMDVDLPAALGQNFAVPGFTAATGWAHNVHMIHNFTFFQNTPLESGAVLSSRMIDFGLTPVADGSVLASFAVFNSNKEVFDFIGFDATITGTDAELFALEATGGSSEISPRSLKSLAVGFGPQFANASGTYQAELAVELDGVTTEVPLVATVPFPDQIDFGTLPSYTQIESREFSVHNGDASEALTLELSVTGPNPEVFSVPETVTITPDGDEIVKVTVDTSEAPLSGRRTATLEFDYNGEAIDIPLIVEVQGDIIFMDFQDDTDWNYVGSAFKSGSDIAVTSASSNRVGAAWLDRFLNISEGFDAAFMMSITGQRNTGADGMTFVMQAAENASTSRIGGSGGSIGLFNGRNPPVDSIAVEFDTWRDSQVVVWHIDEEGERSLLQSRSADTGEDFFDSSADHDVSVKYDAESAALFVYVPNFGSPLMIDADVLDLLGSEEVMVGFTASTGSAYQNHLVRSLSLQRGAAFGDPAPFIPGTLNRLASTAPDELLQIEIPVRNMSSLVPLVVEADTALKGGHVNSFTMLTQLPLTVPPDSTKYIALEFAANGQAGLFQTTLQLKTNSELEMLRSLPVSIGVRSIPPTSEFIVFEDFSDISEWSLVGDAFQAGTSLNITPSSRNQAGAAWLHKTIDLSRGFTSEFEFQFSDQGSSGADGLAFVLQKAETWNPTAIGGYAGDKGYFFDLDSEALPNTAAVVFDTWNSSTVEVWVSDSEGAATRPTSEQRESGAYFDSESPRTATISYDHESTELRIEISDFPSVVVADIDLVEALGSTLAAPGFTAATGDAIENHLIHSWSLYHGSVGSSDTLFSANSISFGETPLSEGAASRELSIRNLRPDSNLFVDLNITGTHADLFSGEGAPLVAPGDLGSFEIVFNPANAPGTGHYNAVLEVDVNDRVTQIPLSAFVPFPSSLDFVISPGELGGPHSQTFTLTNTGGGVLNLSATIVGPAVSEFSTTGPSTISSGNSGEIAVTYSPSTAGAAFHTATLEISSNVPGISANIPLTGIVGEELFHVSDFGAFADIHLAGDARISNGSLNVAPAQADQTGGAWYTEAIDISQGFVAFFDIQFTNLSADGADGLSIMLQNAAFHDPQASPAEGGSAGFFTASDASRAFPSTAAIILDTYRNNFDQSGSEIETWISDSEGAVDRIAPDVVLNSTFFDSEKIHSLAVAYDHEGFTLTVWLTEAPERSYTVEIDLVEALGSEYAVAGFGAATGGKWQNHLVRRWAFYSGSSSTSGQLPDIWLSSYGLEGNLALPEADADGDGFSNLTEYLFGKNPIEANISQLAAVTTIEEDGEDYLAIGYLRRGDDPSAAYEVQVATGIPSGWVAGGTSVREVQSVPLGGGLELAVVVYETPLEVLEKAVFLRVQAVLGD